ncbi:MAG: nucleotidyltransferase family protein [Minisyncoccia bacterium]
MKVVILAAGEGVRMRPLTLTTPKPLIIVSGKPILDHIFVALPLEINEVIIVVGHLGNKIKDYCGDSFYNRRIKYVEGSKEGNAMSFLSAKPFLENEERFLLVQGDELPYKKDVERCLSHKSSSLCWEINDPWNHGVITLKDGMINDIIEKPKNPLSNLISNGVMVITSKIFDCIPKRENNGEYYFSSMFNQYIKKENVVAVSTIYGTVGFSSPEDIKRNEEVLKSRPKI